MTHHLNKYLHSEKSDQAPLIINFLCISLLLSMYTFVFIRSRGQRGLSNKLNNLTVCVQSTIYNNELVLVDHPYQNSSKFLLFCMFSVYFMTNSNFVLFSYSMNFYPLQKKLQFWKYRVPNGLSTLTLTLTVWMNHMELLPLTERVFSKRLIG